MLNRRLMKGGAALSLAAAAAIPVSVTVFADSNPLSTTIHSVTSQLPAGVQHVLNNLGVQTQGTSSPAPAGSASATGLSVPPLNTCISCNTSTANDGTATASAHALQVLGADLGNTTGSSTGNGSAQGNLLAVPVNPLLSAAVADWMTASQVNSDGSSNSNARTALTDLTVGDGKVATVSILETTTSASWSADGSEGKAATNGVDANLLNGALVIILLHSDADSNGHPQAYVASINGNQLLGTSNGTSPLTLTIPGVGTINLLQALASGGVAGAAVGTVTNLLGIPGTGVGALTTNASGTANTGGTPSTGGTSTVNASTPTTGIATPVTGAAMGIAGLLLVAAGFAFVILPMIRRRRAGAAPTWVG